MLIAGSGRGQWLAANGLDRRVRGDSDALSGWLEVAAVLKVLPGILYPAGASQAAQEDDGEDEASRAYSIDESALGGKKVEF